jgi:hypothetical protein
MAFGCSLKSAWGVECFEDLPSVPPITKPTTTKVIKDNKRNYELPFIDVRKEQPVVPTTTDLRGDKDSKELLFAVGLGIFLIVMMDFMVRLGSLLA